MSSNKHKHQNQPTPAARAEDDFALTDESGTIGDTQPSPGLSDEFPDTDLAPDAPPTENTSDLAPSDADVVVAPAAPARPPRVFKVLKDKTTSYASQNINLKVGKLINENHYDAGFIEHLLAAGAELEQVQ